MLIIKKRKPHLMKISLGSHNNLVSCFELKYRGLGCKSVVIFVLRYNQY